MTTDPDPAGHDLDGGGDVITEEQSVILASHGLRIPPGTFLANKREARIKIKPPSSDPKLRQWRTWSRKNCEPGFADALEQSGGATKRNARTWWLYFGVIPSSRFDGVDILVPDTSN